MTFLHVIENCMFRTQSGLDVTSLGEPYLSMIKSVISQVVSRINSFKEATWSWLAHDLTLSLTDSQNYVIVPSYMKYIYNIKQIDPSLKELIMYSREQFDIQFPDPTNTFTDGPLQYAFLEGRNSTAVYSSGTVGISSKAGTFSAAPAASMAGREILLTGTYKEVPYRIVTHTAGQAGFTISRPYYNPTTKASTITTAAFEVDGTDAFQYALYPAPDSTYDTTIIFMGYRAMETPVSDLERLDLPNEAHAVFSLICEDACESMMNMNEKRDYNGLAAYIDSMISTRLMRSHYRDISIRKVQIDPGNSVFRNLRRL